MARKCFYSFHYKKDNWRVSQVRNIGAIEGNKPASDNDWESITKGGDKKIKEWIDEQMKGRTCTVILAGSQTADRKWINYEIKSSWSKNNGILGIYIHNLEDRNGRKSAKGSNPFNQWTFTDTNSRNVTFPVYDWVNDNGYQNMGNWIEQAARDVGR